MSLKEGIQILKIEIVKQSEFIEWLKEKGLFNRMESPSTMQKMYNVWKAANCGNERKIRMNEQEMFEKSFERPSNYFKLSGEERWAIDKRLGILDWAGEDLTKEDEKRLRNHYDK